MEYAHAVLLLDESDKELNEANITAVLDAAGVAVEESRVKALVAALEDVSLDGLKQQNLAAADVGDPTPEPAEGELGTNGDSATIDGDSATSDGDSATSDGDPEPSGGVDAETGGESGSSDSTATE